MYIFRNGILGLFLITFTLAWNSANAQVLLDEFAAGFSTTLGWQGDTDAFAPNGGRLQLLDTRTDGFGRASAWLPAHTGLNVCWSLDVELQFSPSTSNNAKWWLTSDQGLDDASRSGVYVLLGGISGNDDAFELIAKTGTTETTILQSTPGTAANDPVTARLTVCRTDGGNWRLDLEDGAGNVTEFTGSFSDAPTGNFSGLELEYTSTRNGLFFFDNFRIDPIILDTEAPELVLAEALDERTVRLVASEVLTAAATNTSSYLVGGVTPSSVAAIGTDILLSLSADLDDGISTEVNVNGWRDLAGNEAGAIQSFVTYQAPREIEEYEVLISEVMSDPSPPFGLPETEYIELFNASQTPVALNNVALVVGEDTVRLPVFTLAVGAYVAISAEETNDPRFEYFEHLPTLRNSGDELTLLSNDNQRIDQLVYNPSFHDSSKDEGGFSLERLDLTKPCLPGQVNLVSSQALSGGTPGAVNSIAENLSVDSLGIERVVVLTPELLEVSVNRSLSNDFASAFEMVGNSIDEVVLGGAFATYELQLSMPLVVGDLVEVRLNERASSCVSSEQVSRARVLSGIAETAVPGDWELNEIMYDPLSGQGRWVELANVSDKLLQLDDLVLARLDSGGIVSDFFELEEQLLVPPLGLGVLADDVIRLRDEFPTTKSYLVAQTDVPTLSAEECLQLFDPISEEIYWTVCYSEDWHNQAYANTDGVSLERIDLANSSARPTNWTSAAATANFATPTLINSQQLSGANLPESEFSLRNERISPDGDGFEDQLVLDFNFGSTEVLARFEILDLSGRAVLTADEDISPGIAGTWTWDGISNDGDVPPVGTYVLAISYWSPSQPRIREHLAFSLLLAR